MYDNYVIRVYSSADLSETDFADTISVAKANYYTDWLNKIFAEAGIDQETRQANLNDSNRSMLVKEACQRLSNRLHIPIHDGAFAKVVKVVKMQ